MSSEYIFFDCALRDRFLAFVAGLGLVGETRADAMEGYVVALPDDLTDAVADSVEAEYDLLMDEQRDLIDAAGDGDERDLMGVDVELPDGSPCMVRLPAPLARRLFEHFDAEEIHGLVSAIAAAVAQPSAAPLCRSTCD